MFTQQLFNGLLPCVYYSTFVVNQCAVNIKTHYLLSTDKLSNFFFIYSSSPLPVTNVPACGAMSHRMRGRMELVRVTN